MMHALRSLYSHAPACLLLHHAACRLHCMHACASSGHLSACTSAEHHSLPACPQADMAILDEIDSGLDIDALRDVSNAVNGLRTPDSGVLMVTHYKVREAGAAAGPARVASTCAQCMPQAAGCCSRSCGGNHATCGLPPAPQAAVEVMVSSAGAPAWVRA